MTRLFTYIFSILFCLGSFNLFSQKVDERLVQISGVIVSSDSLEPLPFGSVFNKTTGRGMIADIYGFFSIVSRPSDTLVFRYIGYKSNAYIIPDSISTFGHALIHLMDPDTLTAHVVQVYPWPSREEFGRYFVNMDPYEDDIRRAQRELSGKNLATIAAKLPTDAGLTYSWQQQQNQNQLYTHGQSPVNNLFNPAAWAQFIKAWKNGKLKRQ